MVWCKLSPLLSQRLKDKPVISQMLGPVFLNYHKYWGRSTSLEKLCQWHPLALDLFFSFISAWQHTIMEMRTAIWSKAMRDNQKMPGRWNFSLIAVVLVLFLSTACTPGSTAKKPSVPVASASIPGSPELNSLLRRPLHLPSLHTGNPCPTSLARRVFPAFGPAQGNGPAYEAATYDQAPSPAVLLYADTAHFGGGEVS
jgi:hypothetical protein